MPPKPRNPENAGLVSNLYCRNGYYSYRDPRTGAEYGLGRDRAEAIDQAIEANRELLGRGSLIDRVSAGPAGRTLADFEPRYMEALRARKLAEGTRKARKSILATIFKGLGDMPIAARQEDAVAITCRVSDWLREHYIARGKIRQAGTMRAIVADICGEMAAAGWLAVNPITVVRIPTAEIKRQRLNLDDFWRIYNAAASLHPWVQNSMALGIVSLQRREDVAAMLFRHEIDGRLEVVQHKSQGKVRLRIPTRLRLEAVGWSLGEVIARCRDNVVSRHLLHHTTSHARARAGHGIYYDSLTSEFAKARDLAGIAIQPGKTPPTFHELRSLGGRLYQQQGYNPHTLLGHRLESTTARYLDARGVEWIEVAA